MSDISIIYIINRRTNILPLFSLLFLKNFSEQSHIRIHLPCYSSDYISYISVGTVIRFHIQEQSLLTGSVLNVFKAPHIETHVSIPLYRDMETKFRVPVI
jgi:hypothetical protein